MKPYALLLAVLSICTSAVGQDIATYKANGIKWGRTHGANLAVSVELEDFNPSLAVTYYDAIRVFQNLGELTGEDFSKEEASAIRAYRDRYVLPNNGGTSGYWSFTDGLTQHALRTGDAESRRAVILIAKNAAYHNDLTNPLSTVDSAFSREVAYAILAKMNSERLGEPRSPRLKLLLEHALGHYDQCFVSKTTKNVTPFMAGLTATALIRYYDQIEKDKRILPALKTGADWLWDNAWRDKEQGFYYDTDSQTVGTPDLNMLILPLYAWTYKMGGKPKYRLERAQAIFDGGVKGAWLDGPKQFNQNYYRGPEALKWMDVATPSELDSLKAQLKAANAKLDKVREAVK